MELKVGITGVAEDTVTRENTAEAVHSGNLLVFSTPNMIGLMERAAYESVQEFLDEGCTTVGTMVNIVHTAATPVGMAVRAEATLTAVEGRKLCFDIVAYDEKGEIGKGTHQRFIIQKEKFLDKTYDKL